jgi:hypothetical protein
MQISRTGCFCNYYLQKSHFVSDFPQTNNVVPEELWRSADTEIISLETRFSETGARHLPLRLPTSSVLCLIMNDNKQDATILDLFISKRPYMFWAIPSPIIRST